jgi:hypothetical protein
MKKNDIFKLGISIGEMQNHESFSTGTKHPEIAIAQANGFINSKYGPGFNIYFVDDANPRRKRRRRD